MLAVIIPAYNRPEALKQAFESLKQQIFKRFITVVVDDASTEDLRPVCDEANQVLNVVYLRQPVNGGPGLARQRGLDWCYSRNIDLVAFLDSDDLYFPIATKLLTHEINHSQRDVIATPISVEQLNEPFTTIEAERSVTWLHGKIYRTNFLREYNISFPAQRTNEDLAFNLKVFWLASTLERAAHVDTPVCVWRDDKSSLTRSESIIRDNCIGLDYIKAIHDAIKFIDQFPKFDIRRAVTNLIINYNYYQLMLCRGEDTSVVDDIITEMFNMPRVQTALRRWTTWMNLLDSAKPFHVMDKKFYAFPQTFGEWYKQHDGVLPCE